MTDPELLEIRARCEAATPGPWECTDPMETDKMKVMDTVGEVCKTDLYGFEYPECWSNGDFIAHARTDIPALLAHIEELKTALGNEEAESFALGIEIMLGKQVWTTEPKCGAWNWWRLGPEGCPTCRYVYKYGAVDHATRGRIHWQEIGGQWCPIPIPQEPTSE